MDECNYRRTAQTNMPPPPQQGIARLNYTSGELGERMVIDTLGVITLEKQLVEISVGKRNK